MSKRALLLDGGGSKGIVQAGSLKALAEIGYDYECLYSSSAGTLNALLFHAGKVEELVELWLNLENCDVYVKDWFGPFTSRACFYDSTPLKNLIEKNTFYAALLANHRRWIINASSLLDWQVVEHDCKELTKEELITLVYASCSPPIYFPWVKFRDNYLTDSGIINNYCIAQAVNDGYTDLTISSFAMVEPCFPYNNITGAIEDTISMSIYADFDKELGLASKVDGVTYKLIRPHENLHMPILEFEYPYEKRKELIQLGYDLTMKAFGRG